MPVTSPICQYAPTGCWHVGMGATSAEKFEGTSHVVNVSPLLFPLSLPCLPFLTHLCFTNSLPYSSFLLSLSLARRSGEAL